MLELFEKTVLVGIGALSLTQKKTEDLLDEIQKQFNVSEEKGRELLNQLQNTARDNQRKLEELAQEEVRKSCERLGLVPVAEFEKLRRRVEELEQQLQTRTSPPHVPPPEI